MSKKKNGFEADLENDVEKAIYEEIISSQSEEDITESEAEDEEPQGKKKKEKSAADVRTFKNETLAFASAIIVLVVLVLINLLVGKLPAKYILFDTSGSLVYDIGEQTVEALKGVDKDVVFTVLSAKENTDERIVAFLEHYSDECNKISVRYVDPDLNPALFDKYGAEGSCIVVECTDTGKNQLVYFDDIILKQADYNAYMTTGQLSYKEYAFDGENVVTNAVLSVINEVTHKGYYLEGHSEASIPNVVATKLKEMNFEMSSVNLTSTGSVPTDCELLVMYDAATDLTKDEEKFLENYMDNGGQMVVVTAFSEDSFSNLKKFLHNYGITLESGILGDGKYFAQNAYYFQNVPVNGKSESVKDLTDKSVVLVYPQPMSIATDVRNSVTVTPIISSSEYGFTIEGEKNNIYAQYHTALESTETVNGKTNKLIVYSCMNFVQDEVVANYGTSYANLDVFTAGLKSMFPEINTVNIPSETLEVSYNSTSITSAVLALVVLVVFIIVFIVFGIVVWARRRKK